jgi:hypothetical protein
MDNVYYKQLLAKLLIAKFSPYQKKFYIHVFIG